MANLEGMPIYVSNEQVVNFGVKEGCQPKDYTLDSLPGVGFEFDAGEGSQGFEYEGNKVFIYGNPIVPNGIPGFRMGIHQYGPVMHTESYIIPEKYQAPIISKCKRFTNHQDYKVDQKSLGILQKSISKHIPGLDPNKFQYFTRCLYTNTLDGKFIAGIHPEDEDVVLCCAFSGEGAKHSPTLGEFTAALCLRTPLSGLFARMASQFDPARFSNSR